MYFSAWLRLCFCLIYSSRKRQRIWPGWCPGYHLLTTKRSHSSSAKVGHNIPKTLTLEALSALKRLSLHADYPGLPLKCTQNWSILGEICFMFCLRIPNCMYFGITQGVGRMTMNHAYNLVYFWPRALATEQFLTGRGHNLQIVCSKFADICLWQIIYPENRCCTRNEMRY